MGGTLLYGACGAFAAGVAVALLTPVPFLFVLICLALGGASFFFRSRTRHAVPLAVALIAFSCGAGRAHITLTNLASETLPQYIGAKVAIAGRVVGDPDVREASARVVLGDLSIDNEPVSGKLLVSLPPSAEVVYSDQLYVQGNVQAPQTFETQTGRIFDYPNYLRAQGVQAQMSYAKLLATKQSGLSLQSFLFSLKHTFERSLDALLPDPDNALLQGVLLGEKRGISQELTQAFMLSGLVHIVVLSGYNISVVAEAVFRTLGFLPRTLRFGLGGVLMLLFALMTGAGAATVRALIMALVALLARFARRPHLALRALVDRKSVV